MKLKLGPHRTVFAAITVLCVTAQHSVGAELSPERQIGSDVAVISATSSADFSSVVPTPDATERAAVAARKDLDPQVNGSIEDSSCIRPSDQ